jgi:hypothetical protein
VSGEPARIRRLGAAQSIRRLGARGGVRHIRRADAFLLVAGLVWLCALQPDQKHAGQRHADASPRLRAARLGTQCTTIQVLSELARLEDDLAAARSRLPRAARSPWRRSLPSGRWSCRQRSAPRPACRAPRPAGPGGPWSPRAPARAFRPAAGRRARRRRPRAGPRRRARPSRASRRAAPPAPVRYEASRAAVAAIVA